MFTIIIVPGYEDSHKHMVEPPHNFTTPHNRVSCHCVMCVDHLLLLDCVGTSSKCHSCCGIGYCQ